MISATGHTVGRWQLFNMNPKASITIIVILTFLGFSGLSAIPSFELKPNVLAYQPVAFDNFLSNIPTLDLPLTIICGFETTLYESDFNKKYQQFIPKGFEVVGRLQTGNEFNFVLFAGIGDILYPYLFTLNDDGSVIDSIYLHISTCAGDPNLELSTWSVIEKNMTIAMADTAKFFNYIETDSDYIRTLDSTIITKRTVQLDDMGRFVRISEEIKKIN